MVSRTIIHIDLDAFFCAVEELFDPSLRGKPFAVGGKPENRGVVSSCSYAARSMGIHSALPMSRAVILCPDLIILPSRHNEYSKKSREVMNILRKVTDKIEQISIDEAFLDVSHITEDMTIFAKSIQAEILKSCDLPCSMGIASNKLVAKIATDVGKKAVKTNTYPNAIQHVPEGKEATFLAPLPLETLWGVGPKTADNLRQIGIRNIGELAKWPIKDLVSRFGKIGYDLHSRANGIDNRPIETYREPKSISQEITFSKDINDEDKLILQLKKQSEKISNNLEKSNLLCSTVKIKLRWPNFSTISRQITLEFPTKDPDIIYKQALLLFKKNWDRKTPIRLIGMAVSGLQPPSMQLSLWDKVDYKKLAHLEAAINEVKTKFGDESIRKGVSPTSNRGFKNAGENEQ